MLGYRKVFYLAHRVSYYVSKGEIPDGLCIMHSCDNKACVNPEHLSVGTNRENMQDMIRKGKAGFQKKTHCKYGHPLIEMKFEPSTGMRYRFCRTCRKEREARRREVDRRKNPKNPDARKIARRMRPLLTHCRRGHEFTPENIHLRKSDGIRICLACNRARSVKYKPKRKARREAAAIRRNGIRSEAAPGGAAPEA